MIEENEMAQYANQRLFYWLLNLIHQRKAAKEALYEDISDDMTTKSDKEKGVKQENERRTEKQN